MGSKYVKLPPGYLDRMAGKTLIEAKGKFNKRKLLILWYLLDYRKLGSRQLHNKAGKGSSYASTRATLSRLTKYKYIAAHPDHQYTILSKGVRFIYAVKQLHPDIYNELITNIKGVNSGRINTERLFSGGLPGPATHTL